MPFMRQFTTIRVMTAKTEKRSPLLAASLLCFCLAQTAVHAEEGASYEKTAEDASLCIIELDPADTQPLETLKEAVIRFEEENGELSADDISLSDSLVRVSKFEKYSGGLQSAVVSLSVRSDEEDAGIAWSLSQPVLIRTLASDAPLITLTEETVRVKHGDTFDPVAYIAEISDASGILPVISVEGEADTQNDGTYTLTYTVTNQIGKSGSATLNVEVYTPRMVPGTNVDMSTLVYRNDGSVEAMFAAINAVRAEYGLYPYQLADETGLTASAIRAQECTYFLSHTRPDGSPYHTVLDQVGDPHGTVVWEILVAYGDSVETNLGWWLSEPGHARIVLGTSGSTIAIGHSGSVWEALVY